MPNQFMNKKSTVAFGEHPRLPHSSVHVEWDGSHVIVRCKQEQSKLWWGGCFGKGTQSRSMAQFSGPCTCNSCFSTQNELDDCRGSGEEVVMLMAVEVIYLAFHEKLNISHNGSVITAATLWNTFCSDFIATSSNDLPFPHLYACYKYYRDLKWIPRAGTKYGVDFVLYKASPTLCHSEFGVSIVSSGGACAEGNWRMVVATTRVLATVKKAHKLCVVEEVGGDKDLRIDAMGCGQDFRINEVGGGQDFTIDEVEWRRWEPMKTRV